MRKLSWISLHPSACGLLGTRLWRDHDKKWRLLLEIISSTKQNCSPQRREFLYFPHLPHTGCCLNCGTVFFDHSIRNTGDFSFRYSCGTRMAAWQRAVAFLFSSFYPCLCLLWPMFTAQTAEAPVSARVPRVCCDLPNADTLQYK